MIVITMNRPPIRMATTHFTHLWPSAPGEVFGFPAEIIPMSSGVLSIELSVVLAALIFVLLCVLQGAGALLLTVVLGILE